MIRDAGDATAATAAPQPSPAVVRDAGDATAARLSLASKPPAGSGSDRRIEPALGLGLATALIGILVAVRIARSHRLAH